MTRLLPGISGRTSASSTTTTVVDDQTVERLAKLTHAFYVYQESRRYWMGLCHDRDDRIAVLEEEIAGMRSTLGRPDGGDEQADADAPAGAEPVRPEARGAGLLGLPPPVTCGAG